jgi:hypothetical protein
MKTLGIAALAGIGIALLFGTERGRQMMGQAKESLQQLPERFKNEAEGAAPEKIIQQVLEEPHPDTAMAMAFQEAVAA